MYYYDDQVEEMYDLSKDPDEMVNVSLQSAYENEKKRLRHLVDTWWHETGGLSREPILDPESNWLQGVKKS